MRVSTIVRLLGVATVAIPVQLSGQAVEPTIVTGEPTCGGCRIELRHVVTLREDSASRGLFVDMVRVSRDSKGRWFAAPVSGARVGLFDAEGRMRTVVGREGQGPEEFQRIERLRLRDGDSLFVYDRGARTRKVISPEGAILRSDRLPGSWSGIALLPNGREVYSGTAGTSAAPGFPLHLLASDGTVHRSFGLPADDTVRLRTRAPTRFIASDRSGRIWSAQVPDYRIEVFDSSGNLLSDFIFKPSWWRVEPGRAPPRSAGLAITEAQPDVVWIKSLINTPPERAASPGEGAVVTQEYMDNNYDNLVEAFDPRSGRILALRRFPETFRGSDYNGFIPKLRITSTGEVEVDVFELFLVGWER